MTKQMNPWMPVTILLGVLLIASFITNLVLVNKVLDGTTNGNGGQIIVPTGNNGGQVPDDQPVEVKLGDSPRMGDEDAPVTVVEFSDFQCPFCGRYYTDVYPQLKSEYIDTGKVQFVFKQFPLNSIHPQAQKAAEASLCAEEQGKFWEMHDMMFENQGALDVTSLKSYAATVGLNTAQFNNCLDTSKYASKVAAELGEGEQAGVSGTPTSIINGKRVVGAVPYATIKAEIEAALAN